MFSFFKNDLSEEEKNYEKLLAIETSFKFYSIHKNTFSETYRNMQEFKALSIAELNELVKNPGTSNLNLQIIMNIPCLLEKLDNEALAMHVENFFSIASYIIEHPEKASMINDVAAAILKPFPWLETKFMSSPLALSNNVETPTHFFS